MSVINDMLRDLDNRHGAQPVTPFGGIAVVVPPREWPWRLVLIILIFSALIMGAYSVVNSRLARGHAEAAPVNSSASNLISVNSVPENLPPATTVSVQAEIQKTPPAAIAQEVAGPVNQVATKIIAFEKNPVDETAPAPAAAANIATPSMPAEIAPITKSQLHKQPSQTPEALAEESYRLAMDALRHNARSDAERELNNALSFAPNHVAAIAALARLYLEDAHFDAAQQLLAPALSANAEALELRQLLARTQLNLGRAAEAQQLLAARQPELSAHTDYYAMLAALEQQLGKHTAAAQHYDELLNVDNSIAPWWLGLALALDNQQQTREAVAAYRRALALTNLPLAARTFAQQRLSVLEGHL